MDQHADTVPGFTMQSECFYLKFVTGLQCGVSSKLLEYETDWYEVMEILLSRLQDEPEKKEDFEKIASRDLEYWARIQPGGDTLNLKIRVNLEEKRYFLPPSGSRKTLRLIFNDRFSTQVIFHARKKMLLKSLRDLAAIAVADHFDKGELVDKLDTELPKSLIPDVKKAFSNCWTPRFFRTKIVACPPWCACKMWRKPLAILDAKVKRTTRRQLYKRVAGKPVSRKAQQKQGVKKIETKSNIKAKDKKVVAKGSKKCDKVVKKAAVQKKQSKSRKPVPVQCKNNSNKKNLVPKSTVSAKKSTPKANTQNKKSTQKNPVELKGKIQSTPNAKNPKNTPKAKTPNNTANLKNTPNAKNQKKSVMKKNVDNVKVLKDKVKLMKNKLKSLLDTVTTKDKAIIGIKGKLEVKNKKRKADGTKDQVTPKRRSSRIISPHVQEVLGNPKKKQKVDTQSSKISMDGIFSPRPSRRSVQEPSSQTSKDVKLSKSLKAKPTSKSSPKSVSKSKKGSPKPKTKSTEPRMPKIHALKRTLRSQFQEAPTNKRRRQG